MFILKFKGNKIKRTLTMMGYSDKSIENKNPNVIYNIIERLLKDDMFLDGEDNIVITMEKKDNEFQEDMQLRLDGSKTKQDEIIEEIVKYLNEKTNSSFRPNTKETTKYIKARIRDGFTLAEMKQVVDFKCSQWLNDSNMRQYLQPSTLFGNKFEGYLQASKSVAQTRLKGEELEFGMFQF